jgi:hypothetical protein
LNGNSNNQNTNQTKDEKNAMSETTEPSTKVPEPQTTKTVPAVTVSTVVAFLIIIIVVVGLFILGGQRSHDAEFSKTDAYTNCTVEDRKIIPRIRAADLYYMKTSCGEYQSQTKDKAYELQIGDVYNFVVTTNNKLIVTADLMKTVKEDTRTTEVTKDCFIEGKETKSYYNKPSVSTVITSCGEYQTKAAVLAEDLILGETYTLEVTQQNYIIAAVNQKTIDND